MTATTCLGSRRAFFTWLARGVSGLVLLVIAVVAGEPLVSLPALLVALIAFRGCPMCWVFGLIERGAQDHPRPAGKEAP